MAMTAVKTERKDKYLVVVIEGDVLEEITSPRAKKVAVEEASKHGYVGGTDQHSNPYPVDKNGRTKRDLSPFNPKEGDKFRIEYKVFNVGSRR